MENEVLYEWSHGAGSGEVFRDGDKVLLSLSEASELATVGLSKDQARALAAALLKWAGQATPPATVRVRAAVGVQPNRKKFIVCGDSDYGDSVNKDTALPSKDWIFAGWIEADVPLPVPQTIEGTIVEEKQT